MIDSIIDLYEQDDRLWANSRDSDGERYFACIMLAETDGDDIDEEGEGDVGKQLEHGVI